ncbi:MAG: hypothetical protein K0R09_196 [Clostridiales bacterium]|jgi:hypothetical protein|nr:hypothetical protein [Clostridiales bacterium]
MVEANQAIAGILKSILKRVNIRFIGYPQVRSIGGFKKRDICKNSNFIQLYGGQDISL